MLTGERQAARIRELYLAALLRQEIAFFDQGLRVGGTGGAADGAAAAAAAAAAQGNSIDSGPATASSPFSILSASSGQIVAAITSDVLLLQDAISEKVSDVM